MKKITNEDIFVYEKGTPFTAPIELNLLLQHSEIAEALEVIEVKDNEIAIQYEDYRFQMIMTVGKYTFCTVATMILHVTINQ